MYLRSTTIISKHRFTSVSAREHFNPKWELCIDQLSEGAYQADATVIAASSLIIHFEQASRFVRRTGRSPASTWAVAIPLEPDAKWRLNASPIGDEAIAVCAPQEVIDLSIPAGSTAVCVEIPWTEALAPRPDSSALLLHADAGALRGMRELLRRIRYSTGGDVEAASDALAMHLRHQLCNARLHAPIRSALALDALEHAMNRLPHRTALPDIAAQFGVSVRTLHASFMQSFGQSPSQTMRLVRLNRARRELAARPATRCIADVAEPLGFEHLGRFANAYKSLFGVVPSHETRRAPGDIVDA